MIPELRRSKTGSAFALLTAFLALPSVALVATGDPLRPKAPAEIMTHGSIEIIHPMDAAAVEKLPASFVASWPTWVLQAQSGDEASGNAFLRIPDGDGFVNPSSVDELWQPIDLKYPELRLALGLHVRNGQLRHIMPAVDLSFHNGEHRNRGMCSVPRAYGWIQYVQGMEKWVVRLHSLPKSKSPDSDEWNQVATSVPIGPFLERGLEALAASPPDELGDGSHIIHIPLQHDNALATSFLPCPKVGQQMKVTLGGAANAREAAAAPGILQVVVSATMAGSESEYLPDAYRRLYDDQSLRREAYAKFHARQEKKRDDLKKESAERNSAGVTVLMDEANGDVTEL